MTPPTKRMLDFLRWAEREGRFNFWPIEFSAIQRRAEAARYIEWEAGRLQLSESGRRALADAGR